jgi:type IV secretory pathway ATPase VirB11/archaellum biosynthesis ATPase
MTKIFEARSMNRVEDFSTIEEAKVWIEGRGFGSVTTFIRGFDGRDRSCALITLNADGAWRGIDISR